MGGFGANVSALVETYTKCLELLKAFKGHRGSDGDSVNTHVSEAHSHLRSSIRSDRAQVRRAYSSKLSETGSRLERGDSRSRSKIRHILDRLKASILNLLSMAKTQHPVLDYESLMSLSNSSRVDAIKAMDQLSQRLSSSSSLTRKNRRPKSPGSSSTHIRKSSRNSLKKRKEKSIENAATSHHHSHSSDRQAATSHESSSRKSTESRKTVKKRKNSHGHRESRYSTSPLRTSKFPDKSSDIQRRLCISMISTSSDSTQLGEIPQRRSRRLTRMSDISSIESYGIQPIYPLHPYQPPQKTKEGLLRRIFGSRS